ncbi:MAG TPA: cytochrome P450 [Streptosporangiaceae bacterium]|nr:cytochrome P450 [Streptosporangiaceae bacterium]
MTTVGDPLERLLTPAALADPSPVYSDLRDNAPVLWHEGIESWIVSRYSDCALVIKDVERYACDERRVKGAAKDTVELPVALQSLQSLDPPENGPLRHLLIEGLRAQVSRDFEQDLALRVEKAAARLAGREFDFVSEFSGPVVLDSIGQVLGVEPPETSWFLARANAVTAAMDAPIRPERTAPGIAARKALSELVNEWFGKPPADGLLRYLARHWDPRTVDRQVLINSIRAVLHAGFESMISLVNLATAALLDSPQGLAALPPARLDPAVHELVRYTSPVRIEGRIAVADTVIGAQQIDGGSFVTMMLGAANRDPARFERPETLDLSRTDNPHLGFGRGLHSCVGMHLAVTQARVIFAALSRLHPKATLVGRPSYRPTATIRGIDHMVVRFS